MYNIKAKLVSESFWSNFKNKIRHGSYDLEQEQEIINLFKKAAYHYGDEISLTDNGLIFTSYSGGIYELNRKNYYIKFPKGSIYNISKKDSKDLYQEMLKISFEKDVNESLKDVLKPKEININKIEEEINSYFIDYGISLTPEFSIEDFANYNNLSLFDAYTFLQNLESVEIISDISKGNYDSFDLNDPYQFNNGYEDMIENMFMYDE